MKEVIQKILPYLFAVTLLIAFDLYFLSDLLNGSELVQPDMDNAYGMRQEVYQYYKQTGETSYWTNSMFGGMPTYQIWAPEAKFNLFDFIINAVSLFSSNLNLRYFLLLSMGAFLALCFLDIGPWLALIGAVSISFSANHIGLLTEGHLTKIGTLAFIPLIFIGAYLIWKQRWVKGTLLFTLGLAASISQNHIQMVYYTAICLSIYVAAEFFQAFKNKEEKWKKSIGCLLIGTLISCLINISFLFVLKEYSKDTTRGTKILSSKFASTTSDDAGLKWDYAMQWSNGIADLMNLIIPGATGGSSNEKVKSDSKIGVTLKNAGYPADAIVHAPLYWGNLPFTSTPDYLGIVMVLFFLIGLIIIQGPIKWFALISSILIIILSLGKNLSFINKLLFDYLPLYNKFRAPNSSLNILSSIVPIFSVLAIYKFIQTRWTLNQFRNLILKTAGPTILVLVVLLAMGAFFKMTNSTSDNTFKVNPKLYSALLEARHFYFRFDTLRSIILLILAGGLLYLFVVEKIKGENLILGIGILVLFDSWTIARRYLDESDYMSPKSYENLFAKRPVDQQILRDTSLSYRVQDLSIGTYNYALSSYHHKTIGGHHAAKLRRYQDMIDLYFSKSNQSALDMMNTKYIISPNGSLQVNTGALGNAWFVKSLLSVNSHDEEISSIAHLHIQDSAALLSKEFSNTTVKKEYTGEGSIMLTKYSPNDLIYFSKTSADQFAVFSELWYGPNKGWQAYIDHKPVEHVRVNYILRALPVPGGEHTIEFKFNPTTIIRYKSIEWIAKMIFGIILLSYLFISVLKRWNQIATLHHDPLSEKPNKEIIVIKKKNL